MIKNVPESRIRICSIIKFIEFYSTIGISADITFGSFQKIYVNYFIETWKETGRRKDSIFFFQFSSC